MIDGGSVVESGTHADLLNLGPERSLYARQWSAKLLIPPGIPGIPAISFRFWLTFAGTLDSAPRKTYPEFRLG